MRYFREKNGDLICVESVLSDTSSATALVEQRCCFHLPNILYASFSLLFVDEFAPSKGTSESLCIDLRSTHDVIIMPHCQEVIKTGVAWTNVKVKTLSDVRDIDVDRASTNWTLELQVRARSGLAAKRGIGITNGIGTIDADYRGEICAILQNNGENHFEIKAGDKIAQLVPCLHPVFGGWDTFLVNREQRGAGGFGSTGV